MNGSAVIMARKAGIKRKTNETDIAISIDLDAEGRSAIETGIGFFDHMLEQIARHAMVDLEIRCKGDLHIDDHHSVEDVGIALGQAIKEALGDKAGIYRYGQCALPMDEALVECALDFSGRGFLVFEVEFPTSKIGTFDTELVREFFQAVSHNAGLTLHLHQRAGLNSHHIAEASFKAFARAMRMAVEMDSRAQGRIPSTKGSL